MLYNFCHCLGRASRRKKKDNRSCLYVNSFQGECNQTAALLAAWSEVTYIPSFFVFLTGHFSHNTVAFNRKSQPPCETYAQIVESSARQAKNSHDIDANFPKRENPFDFYLNFPKRATFVDFVTKFSQRENLRKIRQYFQVKSGRHFYTKKSSKLTLEDIV